MKLHCEIKKKYSKIFNRESVISQDYNLLFRFFHQIFYLLANFKKLSFNVLI